MALMVLLFMFLSCVDAKGRIWHNFNGFQYSIEMTPVTSYSEATKGCSALQADVANVKTIDVFGFLRSFINLTDKPFSLCIGAQRIGFPQRFQWNDGSYVSVTTTMWYSGQPNNLNGNDNCVTMGYDNIPVDVTTYKFYDVPCTRHKGRYICEKIIKATTTRLFTKPTTNVIRRSIKSTLPAATSVIQSTTIMIASQNITQAPAKLNTAIIASAVGGCVILVISCIVIVVATSRNQRSRSKATNEAVVIEYNTGGDEFEPAETYNIPQIEENSFANNSTPPYSRHQNDDVNHCDAIQEPRHKVAQQAVRSNDVYAQVRKFKQSTKVHDNGQQSHVRKYDHNQLDQDSYDTLQLSQHVEVHDQFASGGNQTNIYDNRHGANDESDSAYDELRRHN